MTRDQRQKAEDDGNDLDGAPLAISEAERAELLRVHGQNLQKLREAKGLTQEDLAARAGCSRNYVSMIERGTRWGSRSMLAKFAGLLGVPRREIEDAYDQKLRTATPQALTSFLETPQGKNAGDAEPFLRSLQIPGRRMTETAYTLALLMWQATEADHGE